MVTHSASNAKLDFESDATRPTTSPTHFSDPNLQNVSPIAESLMVLSGTDRNSPIEDIQRYSINLSDLQARGRYSQSLRTRAKKKGVEDIYSVYSSSSDSCSPLSPPKPDKVTTLFQFPSDLTPSPFNPISSTEPSHPHDPRDTSIISSPFSAEPSAVDSSHPSTGPDHLGSYRQLTDRRKSTRRASRRQTFRPRSDTNRPTSFCLPSYATPTFANETREPPVHQRRASILKKKSLGRSLSASRKNAMYEQGAADEDDKVLIGTRVGEGHANYALMYNMLTGIRVSVSRCSARPMRTLAMADFRAQNKLAFDVTGNELVPSSKYDFKFKDYAPNVFRQIRALFGIDPGEYLMSLTHKYIVSELFSPGKSRSFFYYSRDYRFIIKTVHHVEHRFMLKILPRYFQYVNDHPNTLLTRIYGLHRVKIPYTRKIHFLVMANIFPPGRDIHESYDLKGSTLGRRVDESGLLNPSIPLKDLNWQEKGKAFQLGPLKRKAFLDQLTLDARFLSSLKIMDYSLLVGIHDLGRNKESGLLERSLSIIQVVTFSSVAQRLCREAAHPELRESRSAHGLPGRGAGLGCGNLLQYHHYLGIIDILTPYNYAKKLEHRWKALRNDKDAISAVHPRAYAARFLSFLTCSFKDSTFTSTGEGPAYPPSPRIRQRRLTARRSGR
ncbi:Phosphatidylinositol-4-phosphate 5-kinase [Massospora cicadina]|nr:Phosphatidylinositol-4-phosphate 5-kinase [Massospora cicadina]